MIKPKEPCPMCGSHQLIVHDSGERTSERWCVICRDCGCKGFAHCTEPLAILCWDSGASDTRHDLEVAATIGWTGPMPEVETFHPMTQGPKP